MAFLLVQLVVPLYQLTQPRPARFGWQMYSAISLDLMVEPFHIEDAAGELHPVAFATHLARARPEIDYRTLLPPYLCHVRADAVAVVRDRRGTTTLRHSCP